MRMILTFLLFLSSSFLASGQKLYQCTAVEADFFSSAPVEDIHAVSKKGISVIHAETGEISFKININTFEFQKSLMQEHFNEKFMESDKYPAATFKGNIKDNIELSKDGEHKVQITGVLEIHGVKQRREVPAVIEIRNGELNLSSSFKVACEDHKVAIPKLLWKNIAEVVEVKINANYIPIK